MSSDSIPAAPAPVDSPHHLDTWGQPGHLTPAQEEAVREFTAQASVSHLEKAKFKVESMDNVVLRFLRARNFNVHNALTLLNECIKKKTEGKAEHYASLTPDECANCDVMALQKWYPHGQFGFDKFNRPIVFEHSGGVDGQAIYQMTSLEGCINYHWWSMEHALNERFEEAARRGPLIISTCAILDFTGLNTSHASKLVLDHVKTLVGIDNVCYPETLGKMFVINAPWLAVGLWEMAKGWLDPRTQAKIEILGSGPDTVKRLLEYIPADQLPKSYGGTAADLYHVKDHTEHLHVNRYTALKKTITVPAGKKVLIDSYICDGELGLEVYSTPAPAVPVTVFTDLTNTGHQHHTPATHESISPSEMTRLVSHTKDMHLLVKKELKGHPDKKAVRTLLEYVNTDAANRTYTIFWVNTARLITRELTYTLTIVDP